MAETVIVRQNSRFETTFAGPDPRHPESGEVQPVYQVQGLTPYGLMLASLGGCTASVLNTYAQHHDLSLDMVEVQLTYRRIFKDDCDDCENIDRYDEKIEERIFLSGDLTPDQRQRLLRISHQCPINKMFQSGIEIQSRLAEIERAREV
jgi:putative redox protein